MGKVFSVKSDEKKAQKAQERLVLKLQSLEEENLPSFLRDDNGAEFP